MFQRSITRRIKLSQLRLITALLFTSFSAHASFIESTLGAAVVNDATATYYNPAALSLLTTKQIIGLGSFASFQSQFTGRSTLTSSGLTQAGTSRANSYYFLPTLYAAMPLTPKLFGGVALIDNDFNRDVEGHSILRYVQAGNDIQAIDLVPAIAYQFSERIAIGAGLTLSRAHFLMKPIVGLPSLNIPDSQSRNNTRGNGWGGDIGILIKPSTTTVLGFNFRSAVAYRQSGSSTINTNPSLTSNDYQFKYWTPARGVFSINQFLTRKLGLIGTVQYIKWDIFKNVHVYNIATRVGTQPTIIPSATVPYHFHNSWVFTLGNHYRVSPDFIIRAAASFVQSPSSGQYQIDNGNTLLVGVSAGYQLFKKMLVDGSYAHSFTQNKNIHISNRLNSVNGVNESSGNAVALKLTFNID